MVKSALKYLLYIMLVVSLQLTPGLLQADQPTASQQQTTAAKETSPEDESQTKAKQEKKQDPETVVLHNEITVTATRTETTVFNTPKPVSVISQKNITEKAPNNLSELLPEMPRFLRLL